MNVLDKSSVISWDLGRIGYQKAWDFQENLLQHNVAIKMKARSEGLDGEDTRHYLLLCEHDPVFTLGKSGKPEHILISKEKMKEKGIEYFSTNRGGDITFHGPEQLVGYPILDLEKFDTDIGKYLRNIEEVIIRTIAEYGIVGERSTGETGVWLDADHPAKARKICAIGVRCSRWITMHGFALNVNTDLNYFNYIIPCGIHHKQVTSMQKELNEKLDFRMVKNVFRQKFEEVFDVQLEKDIPLPDIA